MKEKEMYLSIKIRSDITTAGSEVFTPVFVKTIFTDMTPCSPLKVSRRFEGTYLLHLQL
jgi:hypothetical protein